jgi:DNA-binding transcriptional MerR regulator
VPDDGAGLLTIGEFARRSRLSMRALRLYDRIALLRPAEVVPETGHRRYAGRQLYAARLIALLRRLDMPLTQIAEIVHAAGPDAARLLAQYWTDVERRLAAQRDLADRLVGSLASETPAPPGTWRVAERDVPEQVVLTEQRYVTAAQLTWIRDATARLTAVADRCGGPAGPRFVVFHNEVTEDSDGPVEVCVPISPGTVDPAAAPLRREPAHRLAYVPVVKGHFEPPQILSVYDTVHRWIRSRGLREVGPPREVYRYAADPDAAGPEDLVCDVAIPFG